MTSKVSRLGRIWTVKLKRVKYKGLGWSGGWKKIPILSSKIVICPVTRFGVRMSELIVIGTERMGFVC